MSHHPLLLCCRKTVLEYGFHALREEKKARYIAFRDSLLQVEKQEEQTEQEKQQQLQQQQQQQQQQQEKARQAEEELYYAQQQTELAASGRKALRGLQQQEGHWLLWKEQEGP